MYTLDFCYFFQEENKFPDVAARRSGGIGALPALREVGGHPSTSPPPAFNHSPERGVAVVTRWRRGGGNDREARQTNKWKQSLTFA